MNQGLKLFETAGTDVVHKEMQQLRDRKLSTPINAAKLSRGDGSEVLKYLMFLKMKWDGLFKGRGCYNGRKQMIHSTKVERISLTVEIESLMISCVVNSKQGRKVVTLDIPGAFIQADMDDLVHVKFKGIMAEMLVKTDPEKYKKYTIIEQGKLVIYDALFKAL